MICQRNAPRDLAGALQEQGDGAVVLQHARLYLVRHRQPLHFKDPFPLQAQLFARGQEYFYLRHLLQDLAQQRGAGQDMLEVVEDQQGLLAAQVTDDHILRIHRSRKDQTQCIGDGGKNVLSGVDAGHRKKEYPVGKIILQLVGGLDRQAGLAHATRPGQGQQATGRVPQLADDHARFMLTSDQGSGRDGQIACKPLGCRRRLKWGRSRDRIQVRRVLFLPGNL